MRVLVQRVSQAAVSVDNREVGRISRGFLLLVGMGEEDVADHGAALAPMAEKIINLRVMSDDAEKMNLSLLDIQGEILAISQFTLYADCRRGRRPSFSKAAPPAIAADLFNQFVEHLRKSSLRVATGEFGAMMQVGLVNDGPVTIWLDSKEVLPS